MADQKYEYGRAARLYTIRSYLGLGRYEMARRLGIRKISSYQRWEGGQAPIPSGLWDSLNALLDKHDTGVAKLVLRANGGPLTVPVQRPRKQDEKIGPDIAGMPPEMWMSVVGHAMHANPLIEPHVPEGPTRRPTEPGKVSRTHEYGRAGRILTLRYYLGLERDEIAPLLGIALSSYQRLESGAEAIPIGLWDRFDAISKEFDREVAALVDKASGGPMTVRVWRGYHRDAPFPVGMWMRIVSEAMRENPLIEPVFPEDDER